MKIISAKTRGLTLFPIWFGVICKILNSLRQNQCMNHHIFVSLHQTFVRLFDEQSFKVINVLVSRRIVLKMLASFVSLRPDSPPERRNGSTEGWWGTTVPRFVGCGWFDKNPIYLITLVTLTRPNHHNDWIHPVEPAAQKANANFGQDRCKFVCVYSSPIHCRQI